MSGGNPSVAIAGLWQVGPINNPTVTHILELAPHLTETEAAELINDAARDKHVEFIGPPTTIRGAEHIYKLDFPSVGVPQLAWGGCYRRLESYCQVTAPANYAHVDYPYRERVSDYAEVNYGESLVWDRSQLSITYVLVNPDVQTTVMEKIGLATKCFATYASTWERMLAASAAGYPLVQILEQNLLMATVSPHIAAELQGCHPAMPCLQCAACGGGLAKDRCSFCRKPIQPIGPDSYETPPPIPLGVCHATNLLDTFSINPINAVKASYMSWAASDFTSPAYNDSRGQRVITLKDDDA